MDFYLHQGVLVRVVVAFVAVAALKGLEHGGDGERQQHEPDDDWDLRRFLEGFEEILPTGVHHVEVPVDGRHRQEGDAGPSVQKQHEEHGLADDLVLAPSLSLDEVVGLDGQAEEQQNISQHQVEEEDVVGVGFPELQLEYEEVEDGRVQRQSQDENHNHDSCIKLIQRLVCGFTVLDLLVQSAVLHLDSRGRCKHKLEAKGKKNLSDMQESVLLLTDKEITLHTLHTHTLNTHTHRGNKNLPNKSLQCPELWSPL